MNFKNTWQKCSKFNGGFISKFKNTVRSNILTSKWTLNIISDLGQIWMSDIQICLFWNQIFFGVPHSNFAQSYLDVGILNLADELLLSGISIGTGVEGDGSNSSVMIVVEKVIERLFHELIKY